MYPIIKAVPKTDWFLRLSTEGFDSPTGSEKEIPIYGDFSTQIAAQLNEIYAKQDKADDLEKVNSLGHDLDDPANEKSDYQVGRVDYLDGIDNSHVTMRETHLAIENVNTLGGYGMYDIGKEIAGLTMGTEGTVIFTTNKEELGLRFGEETLTKKIRELIVEGKHVVIIVVIPKEEAITDVPIPTDLAGLMGNTNRLTVYVTYVLN